MMGMLLMALSWSRSASENWEVGGADMGCLWSPGDMGVTWPLDWGLAVITGGADRGVWTC